MYDVKIIHFYMVEYKKNGKKMNIEIDLREEIIQIGIVCICKWEPPFDNEELDIEERYNIARDIKLYLENKKGMKCEIVE